MTKREEIREKIVDLIEHDAPVEEIALFINGSMEIIDKEKEELAKMKTGRYDWEEDLSKCKTVFLSFPMRDRTHEAIMDTIETMTRLAKIYFGDDVVIRHNYDKDLQVLSKHPSVSYLGLALRKMATCDYFFGCRAWDYSGCLIENDVANGYDFEKVAILSDQEWQKLPCFEDVRERYEKACTTTCNESVPC